MSGELKNQSLFPAQVSQSYMCNADQTFTMGNLQGVKDMKLETMNLQVQAFHTGDKSSFDTREF